MFKYIVIALFGLLIGAFLGYFVFFQPWLIPGTNETVPEKASVLNEAKLGNEVWGFLPYWFLDKARSDYSGYITTLDYFGLTIDSDGTILRSTTPVELEPGYYALKAGKLDPFFETAKSKNIKLSLTVFSADRDAIDILISDPIPHADNLINEIEPIMRKYGFSDLNLDIEPVGFASPSAQLAFQRFVGRVRDQFKARNLGTISMDIIPVDFIKNDRLNIPSKMSTYLDKVILMAYDFHSPSSFVTGSVAPLYGAGTIAEFDTEVSIEAALKSYSPDKLLLGMPTYGYSWETIDNFERAAVVPASVQIFGNKTVEDFLANCATCSAQLDPVAQEKYIIYKNDTGTYQQIFYPEAEGVKSKINFVKGNSLGGLAIWALGYEGDNILKPIQSFLLDH